MYKLSLLNLSINNPSKSLVFFIYRYVKSLVESDVLIGFTKQIYHKYNVQCNLSRPDLSGTKFFVQFRQGSGLER